MKPTQLKHLIEHRKKEKCQLDEEVRKNDCSTVIFNDEGQATLDGPNDWKETWSCINQYN